MKAIIVSLMFLTTLAYSWEQMLSLSVVISKDYLEILARGGSLPKLFYKEEGANLWALHKESEEDPGKIKMSVYSKSDSAYLDANNKFITELSAAKPGSTVATISRNSARKLACGQSGSGVEDICSNGKLAISLKPRSVYDELARYLVEIHDRFIDDPTTDEITIITDDLDNLDIAFNKIAKIMDIAKAAGFYKIKITYISDDVNSAKTAKIIDKAKKAGYHINILEHNKPVKSNFSAYDLMKDKNFTKDIEKVLKNVKNLEKTAK